MTRYLALVIAYIFALSTHALAFTPEVEMERLLSQMKTREAGASERKAAYDKKVRIYQRELEDYKQKVADCPNRFEAELRASERLSLIALDKCNALPGCYQHQTGLAFDELSAKRERFLLLQRDGVDEYCHGRYIRPTEPTMPK